MKNYLIQKMKILHNMNKQIKYKIRSMIKINNINILKLKKILQNNKQKIILKIMVHQMQHLKINQIVLKVDKPFKTMIKNKIKSKIQVKK